MISCLCKYLLKLSRPADRAVLVSRVISEGPGAGRSAGLAHVGLQGDSPAPLPLSVSAVGEPFRNQTRGVYLILSLH